MFTFRYKAQQRGNIPIEDHLSIRQLAQIYLGDQNKYSSLQRRINGQLKVMGKASGRRGGRRKDNRTPGKLNRIVF